MVHFDGLWYADKLFLKVCALFLFEFELKSIELLCVFLTTGALGVMYNEGLGIKQDLNSAFICLKDAASRGNIYAMGHLVAYYYQRKLFAKSVELAAQYVSCLASILSTVLSVSV